MSLQKDIDINEILKSMREQIGEQAQTIAILKATIEVLTKAKESPVTTTAVPLIPNVEGTKGI
jgi:hypothetical protein